MISSTFIDGLSYISGRGYFGERVIGGRCMIRSGEVGWVDAPRGV